MRSRILAVIHLPGAMVMTIGRPPRRVDRCALDDAEAATSAKRKYRRKKRGGKNATGESKNGPCEVCNVVCDLVWDHCHKSGEFRGWLCNRCNSGLGHFRDSELLLASAIKYLNRRAVPQG